MKHAFTTLVVIAATLPACVDSPSSDDSTSTARADTQRSVAPTPAPADSATDSSGSNTRFLTSDGLGSLRIGMTRAQVVAAMGDDANPSATGGPDPATCDEFRPARAPTSVLVMIERDVLTRISLLRNATITTPDGLGIGTSASRVMDVLGQRADTERHAYLPPPARYITVWDRSTPLDQRRGVRFEIDANDRVVSIRAGSASITNVEGCV